MDAVNLLSKNAAEYGITATVMFVLLVAFLYERYCMGKENSATKLKLMDIIADQAKIAQRSTDALENNSKALWEVASVLKGCPQSKPNQQRENQ